MTSLKGFMTMELESARLIAAAIAVLPLTGVGLGLGSIFNGWLSSLARNPSVAPKMQLVGVLGFALTEAVGLFALVVAFLILFG